MSVKGFYVEAREVRGFNVLLEAIVTEAVDCREGVLLDSALYYAKDMAIAVFDTYETANSSGYTVFIGNDEESNREVEKKWYRFCESYDAKYGEEE